MNFQWMPLGGLFWLAAQREAGKKAKEKVANPLMKFLIKEALNACLFKSSHPTIFESRPNWSREWVVRMQKDSTIKETGTSGSKWRPESNFEPGSGNFHGGQFSWRFSGCLSFSSLTLKSKKCVVELCFTTVMPPHQSIPRVFIVRGRKLCTEILQDQLFARIAMWIERSMRI